MDVPCSEIGESHTEQSLPGMQFYISVVIFAPTFPHAKIRHTICTLNAKHQVLNKCYLQKEVCKNKKNVFRVYNKKEKVNNKKGRNLEGVGHRTMKIEI